MSTEVRPPIVDQLRHCDRKAQVLCITQIITILLFVALLGVLATNQGEVVVTCLAAAVMVSFLAAVGQCAQLALMIGDAADQAEREEP